MILSRRARGESSALVYSDCAHGDLIFSSRLINYDNDVESQQIPVKIESIVCSAASDYKWGASTRNQYAHFDLDAVL